MPQAGADSGEDLQWHQPEKDQGERESEKETEESEGRARQIEIYRRMSPAQRLMTAMQFCMTARKIKAAALRAQHPDWNEEQVLGAMREAFLYARS